MHIGLIGGIGPAATVAYYTRLVAAFRAAGVPLELTIVHADVAVLGQNIEADQRAAQAEIFARHIQQLKAAGCDVATITALSGHFCFAETEAISALPLVNPITLVDDYCRANDVKVLGLLGSDTVMETRLFGQVQASRLVVPDGDLGRLGDIYMDMAMSGVCSEDSRKVLIDAGAAMVRDGADAVLLAGTDLGLAFYDQNVGYPVIDALEIHVDGLLAMATV